jgi:hypothetical protein
MVVAQSEDLRQVLAQQIVQLAQGHVVTASSAAQYLPQARLHGVLAWGAKHHAQFLQDLVGASQLAAIGEKPTQDGTFLLGGPLPGATSMGQRAPLPAGLRHG